MKAEEMTILDFTPEKNQKRVSQTTWFYQWL